MLNAATQILSNTERSRFLTTDIVRRRALERLYEKKMAVDELIRSMELYQQTQEKHRAQCIDFSAAQKCLSGFSQSQT